MRKEMRSAPRRGDYLCVARMNCVRPVGEMDGMLGWRGWAPVEVLSHEEEDSVIAEGSLGLSGGFWSGGERPRGVGILCA